MEGLLGNFFISAMIEILYATGLRVSELVSISIAAVSGDPEVIFIKGKGRKERAISHFTKAKKLDRSYRELAERKIDEINRPERYQK